MKKLALLALTFVFALTLAPQTTDTAQADPEVSEACWGQVTKAFIQDEHTKGNPDAQGKHASSFAPGERAGLRNLARQLYDEGIIPAPTIQALGSWIADQEGLSVDACED